MNNKAAIIRKLQGAGVLGASANAAPGLSVGNPATSTFAKSGFKAGQGMMQQAPVAAGGPSAILPQLMGGKKKKKGGLTGLQNAAKRKLEGEQINA